MTCYQLFQKFYKDSFTMAIFYKIFWQSDRWIYSLSQRIIKLDIIMFLEGVHADKRTESGLNWITHNLVINVTNFMNFYTFWTDRLILSKFLILLSEYLYGTYNWNNNFLKVYKELGYLCWAHLHNKYRNAKFQVREMGGGVYWVMIQTKRGKWKLICYSKIAETESWFLITLPIFYTCCP